MDLGVFLYHFDITHVCAYTYNPLGYKLQKFIPNLSFLFTLLIFFSKVQKVCFCQYFPLLHLSFESYFRKFAQLLIYRGIHLYGSHILFEGNNER